MSLWNRKDRLAPFPHHLLPIRAFPAKGVSLCCADFFARGTQNERRLQRPERKLIYCSRTVPEIEKALAELKRLMEYRFVCRSRSWMRY